MDHPASTCTRSSTRWWSSPGSPRSRGSRSTSECSTGSLLRTSTPSSTRWPGRALHTHTHHSTVMHACIDFCISFLTCQSWTSRDGKPLGSCGFSPGQHHPCGSRPPRGGSARAPPATRHPLSDPGFLIHTHSIHSWEIKKHLKIQSPVQI